MRLRVGINILHLSIPLFRETLRRRLQNSAQIKRSGNTDFIKNSTLPCPVEYLPVYLQKAKLDVPNDKESPLICCISKTKSSHKISKRKGISYSRIREVFKDYISEIAATPENFGVHGLRSGGASAVMASLID